MMSWLSLGSAFLLVACCDSSLSWPPGLPPSRPPRGRATHANATAVKYWKYSASFTVSQQQPPAVTAHQSTRPPAYQPTRAGRNAATTHPAIFISSLLAAVTADVSYDSGPSFSHDKGDSGGGFLSEGENGRGGKGGGGGGYTNKGISCGTGRVPHVDGTCVTLQVITNLYVYRPPDVETIVAPRPSVPPPRVEHNIVFIHTPESLVNQQPVVVPPPQQKNVVYVLSKRTQQDQQVIHVPAPEQEAPEIFFVNYAEGENPSLPTGGDLQSALSKASQGSVEVVPGSVALDGEYTIPPRLYRNR
ncbi:hypothetical protein E2C01_069103 [Portunus trituberculatus]|uniref:DUF243 domain-containing protein n=1 Tax=Portunus trituberculatus TaxID=210409 RepID=A0A5B7HYH6_PORTR|nr:hypothetical protein [Portunus trituberculatus]